MYNSYVLSIGGLDPTAGAGILADIKAFEHAGVYGFGVCTGLTAQDENTCYHTQWLSSNEIFRQLEPLVQKYTIKAVKIGAIGNFQTLLEVLKFLRMKLPESYIIWDPILTSSSGKVFLPFTEDWKQVLPYINLMMPNLDEWDQLNTFNSIIESFESIKMQVAIYLKGGHTKQGNTTTEYFVDAQSFHQWEKVLIKDHSKHGTGCVVSSLVTAYIAQGITPLDACKKATHEMNLFIQSNTSRLGSFRIHETKNS